MNTLLTLVLTAAAAITLLGTNVNSQATEHRAAVASSDRYAIIGRVYAKPYVTH